MSSLNPSIDISSMLVFLSLNLTPHIIPSIALSVHLPPIFSLPKSHHTPSLLSLLLWPYTPTLSSSLTISFHTIPPLSYLNFIHSTRTLAVTALKHPSTALNLSLRYTKLSQWHHLNLSLHASPLTTPLTHFLHLNILSTFFIAPFTPLHLLCTDYWHPIYNTGCQKLVHKRCCCVNGARCDIVSHSASISME